jgi:hypothetical protein
VELEWSDEARLVQGDLAMNSFTGSAPFPWRSLARLANRNAAGEHHDTAFQPVK